MKKVSAKHPDDVEEKFKDWLKRHKVAAWIVAVFIVLSSVLGLLADWFGVFDRFNDGDSKAATSLITINEATTSITASVPTTTSLYDSVEQALREKLEAATDKKIGWFDCYDYDGDGVREAFAIVGVERSTEFVPIADKHFGTQHCGLYSSPEQEGDLWYISTQGLTRLRRMIEGYNSYHWEPKKVNVGSNTILVLCENKGNLNLEYFWSVENGEAVFHDYISGKGEFFDSDGHSEFVLSVCTDEDIGELSDRNPDGNPFTKKWYWFYWDASEKMIKEHGGIEITQQQFLKYTGAQKIIKAIRSEGYRIVNIFYRDNHLFNVNYVDSRGVFGNVALVYSMDFEMGDNKMIYLKNYFDSDTPIGWEYDSYAYDFCEKFSEAANRGIYKKSLAPEIATYPKELPKP